MSYLVRGCFTSEGKAAKALLLLHKIFPEMYWKVEIVEVDMVVLAVVRAERSASCNISQAIALSGMRLLFADLDFAESGDMAVMASEGGMDYLDPQIGSDKEKIARFKEAIAQRRKE